MAQLVKSLPAMWETWVQSLGWEDPLEENITTTLVFVLGESPWTEKPGGLQSMHPQSQIHLSTVAEYISIFPSLSLIYILLNIILGLFYI